jgi:hypothetical protein
VSLGARLLLALLVADAVLLAVLELFFLPLRLAPERGGWMVPLSIAAAAVSTPLLVRSAARLDSRMLVAGAPLAAWLATILLLGVAGPGGDVVLPADFRSLLLLFAGVVPAGVVLGRRAAEVLTAATAPGGMAPDRTAPDRATPDRVAPGPVAPDRATPDRATPGRLAPGRVAPEREEDTDVR